MVVDASLHRSKYDERRGGIESNALLDNEDTAREVSRDIWALSSCDLLVATMTSSVAHVVYGLMIARLGRFPPVISLVV